jgi:uncharacterized protein YjbI with pentapeptide repeats/energy-coupling factor transporter ATP-binding protein EcfA2
MTGPLLSSREAPLLSSPTNDPRREVFPWMDYAIVEGAFLGVLAAFGLAQTFQVESKDLLFAAAVGALAGASIGICLSLFWSVPASADPVPPRDLWDPWLDAEIQPVHEDPGPAAPALDVALSSESELHHWRAPVRPRVLSPETGESLPLTDYVAPVLAAEESGAIRLLGPPGSGKTTALGHLAGVVPPHMSVSFLDNPHIHSIDAALSGGWVVFTSDGPSIPKNFATDLHLAPWGDDEWIEYLLACDPQRCADVMARIHRDKAEAARLDGIPEVWRVVLDRMMTDASVAGPRAALRNELASLLPGDDFRAHVEADCFHAIISNQARYPSSRLTSLRRIGVNEGSARLIRHRPVGLLLAADCVARAVRHPDESDILANALPYDLVRESASSMAGDKTAVDRLSYLLTNPGHRQIHPVVASVLHALGAGWKAGTPVPRLAGAYLQEAAWAEIDLTRADLQGADLSRSNLRGSRLDSANLEDANLVGAELGASSLLRAAFKKADLTRASLESVRAATGQFQSARLVAANLARGNFDFSSFEGADLTDACLADVSLVGADLRYTTLKDADFSRADLSRAIMHGLSLNAAQFTGARFKGADLSHCNLEEMALLGAVFADANLENALLTGSRMPAADFSKANLRAAGLAEIDWEGADLREADLRQAAFHLGSSRSGLVGSPIACEGSRTGFYTDDWTEQDYKSPEEIRKANLCGADLRGARIDDVDFYLVDLRGAKLDPKKIPHIRRCGAILEARV